MKKVIKNREDFINENYYETSSTMVPGQGVGAGLFPGHSITEKDVPQEGANGVKSDPDYRDPSQDTHATYGNAPQLGDMVEDVNPDCPKYKSMGKVFSVYDGKVEYIIANEGDNYALGEVARVAMSSVKLLKKHQMNK